MPDQPSATRIIIMAKTPAPGRVKTRLIPALGANGAANLARRMLAYTTEQALSARRQRRQLGVELCVSPDPASADWHWARNHPALTLRKQASGDLGRRMHRAAAAAIGNGERVILIGTDCPAVDAGLLLRATKALDQRDAVMCPTVDGGYALLGLRHAPWNLFSEIPWSTSRVADITLSRLQDQCMRALQLQMLQDIDEPHDLTALPAQWKREFRGPGA